MKEWMAEHKVHLAAGLLLVMGSIYYFFMNQPENASDQLTAIGKSAALGESAKSTASGDTQKSTASDETKQTKKGQMSQSEKTDSVIVDVKGEIKQPGVYPSNQTERVYDVIQRAGGLTDQADQSQVNFAAHVQDEMVIYVPAKGEENVSLPASSPASAVSSTTPGKNTGKININKADESELQNLPGIGPAKATSIIKYRQENGPFQTVEDLKKISGIGDKTFEKLKESISVQ